MNITKEVTPTIPPDLPDLLRIACDQGKMRLNVWFNAPGGFQANLANAGDGWTVTVHPDDALEAITAALRSRYGRMLERKRAAPAGIEDLIG